MKKIIVLLLIGLALSFQSVAGLDEGITDFQKGDYSSAIKELMPLAKNGNARAQFYVGSFYFNDDSGLSRNQEEGASWLLKSAQGGDMYGQFLYNAYYQGWLGRINDGETVTIRGPSPWLEASAKQGFPLAQYTFALSLRMHKTALEWCFKNKDNCPKNTETPSDLKKYDKAYPQALSEAAKSGEPDALYDMGDTLWQSAKDSGLSQEQRSALKAKAKEIYHLALSSRANLNPDSDPALKAIDGTVKNGSVDSILYKNYDFWGMKVNLVLPSAQ